MSDCVLFFTHQQLIGIAFKIKITFFASSSLALNTMLHR